MNITMIAGYDTATRSHGAWAAALAVAVTLALGTGTASACSLGVSGTLTIEGSTVTTDCVTVAAGGKIIIGDGGTLVLTGSYGNNSSTINGRIELQDSTSAVRITCNSHVFTGSGYIEGQDNSAKIAIGDGLKLTNCAKIRGALLIDDVSGAANFTNQGNVEANASGTLTIAVGGTVDDNSSAKWKATAANAILKLDSAIGTVDGLDGDFVISGSASAEIEVWKTLDTAGRLIMSSGVLDLHESAEMGDGTMRFMSMTGGQIVVASGKTFTHN